MFKTLSAALIAASMLIAPITANAAQPAAAPTTTTKTDKLVKTHKRHAVKHHARAKFAKHARHHNKFVSHKRHGKFVKAHVRHGKLVKAHKTHGKIVKVTKVQKSLTPTKVQTSAK
jgi:Ni/Co efflux regulator RcnB